MILADTRHRLTREDAQLALHLIARAPEGSMDGAEEALRDRGIDALLDDPRLLGALLAAPQGAFASLPLLAYVVVRHALLGVGEEDRRLADYVSAVFLHFGLRRRAERVSETDDETYDSLAALAEDLDDADARRAFLVRAHLGNYALWLSGLFPDYIETRRWRRGEQRAEEARVVEERVDAAVAQRLLGAVHAPLGRTRDQVQRQLRVLARQTMTGVGENHRASAACLLVLVHDSSASVPSAVLPRDERHAPRSSRGVALGAREC